jgi:hypothetical protein
MQSSGNLVSKRDRRFVPFVCHALAASRVDRHPLLLATPRPGRSWTWLACRWRRSALSRFCLLLLTFHWRLGGLRGEGVHALWRADT